MFYFDIKRMQTISSNDFLNEMPRACPRKETMNGNKIRDTQLFKNVCYVK